MIGKRVAAAVTLQDDMTLTGVSDVVTDWRARIAFPDRLHPYVRGLVALNAVKELMADLGRPHDNLCEVALWADMLRVQDDELFYA